MATYRVKTPKQVATWQRVTHVCKAADRVLSKNVPAKQK